MNNRNMSIIVAVIVLAGAGYFVIRPFINQENYPSTGVIQDFTMTVESFKYTPNVLEVSPGDTVIIQIEGLDNGGGNGHGFSISAFDVNESILMDETVDVEFIADKKGTFTFSCSVPCGSGHLNMKGTLIVE